MRVSELDVFFVYAFLFVFRSVCAFLCAVVEEERGDVDGLAVPAVSRAGAVPRFVYHMYGTI